MCAVVMARLAYCVLRSKQLAARLVCSSLERCGGSVRRNSLGCEQRWRGVGISPLYVETLCLPFVIPRVLFAGGFQLSRHAVSKGRIYRGRFG